MNAAGVDPRSKAADTEGIGWDAAMASRPVFELLAQSAERFPDRPCMDFLGRGYTYAETLDLVNRAAKGFQDLGVGKGSRVGLCLPNSPYFVVCYYAVLKAGGTVVNFNPLYTRRELNHQIEDSGTTIMVTLDLEQIYPKLAQLVEATALGRLIVCPMVDILPALKGVLFSVFKRRQLSSVPDDAAHVTFRALTDNDGDARPATIEPTRDLAVLQYTGGTTGTPKGAMLTHSNISANTAQLLAWSSNIEPGEERMLAVLPFFHAFAMTVAMNVGIACAAELIVLPRFKIGQVLETIDKKRPTLFPGVPTIYSAIVSAPDLSSYDLSSIKTCISGGAPLPLEVKGRFEHLTGCVLAEGYGLSEASPVATCNPIEGVNKAGSIGLPLPATVIDIHSLDDARVVLPTGEKGEIWVSGPQVMAGYWNNAEETANVLEDGTLKTGDVGYRDDDGYIFIVDRLKDIIVCSGYKVYPRVVEEAIYLHPGVEEAAVVGVPDAYRGETPKAFIKLKDGASLDAAGLRAFLEDKLSPIEMPKRIEWLDELPKTAVGKISKKELLNHRGSGTGDGEAIPTPR